MRVTFWLLERPQAAQKSPPVEWSGWSRPCRFHVMEKMWCSSRSLTDRCYQKSSQTYLLDVSSAPGCLSHASKVKPLPFTSPTKLTTVSFGFLFVLMSSRVEESWKSKIHQRRTCKKVRGEWSAHRSNSTTNDVIQVRVGMRPAHRINFPYF